MVTSPIGEGGLFEYNSTYKLLICRQCRYAIQKNALESHLLRHKIYRRDRQRLLSTFGQLDLLEPQHVKLPPTDSPPIGVLPIFPGFCCAAVGCGHLTASVKRMKRHQSEVHGFDGSAPLSTSLARPVELQTFFRGTKIRYFQVASSSVSQVNGFNDVEIDNNYCHNETQADAEIENNSVATIAVKLPQGVPATIKTTSSRSPADFNLETLVYFHQFLTHTSSTLPTIKHSQHIQDYWQVHVVNRALQLHWLMCGLLAISAYHLVVVADDPQIRQTHRERQTRFLSEFLVGLQQKTACSSEPDNGESEQELKNIAEQIWGLLRFADYTLTDSIFDLESTASQQFHFFLSALRDCTDSELALHYKTALGVEDESHTGSLSQGLLREGDSNCVSPHASASGHSTLTMILDLLGMLPSRMAERLGRPENVQDVLATMSAKDALVKCCNVSFTCDEAGPVWHGMVQWLANDLAHFNEMISSNHPAALVLLAHWAAILVKRAEGLGCWFLKGSAKKIVLLAMNELSKKACAALDLVECLVSMVDD